jgi:hypothetical protein
MGKKDGFTKILAIVGTILVWMPILAPIIFSLIRFIQARRFSFDYMLPAELFILVMIGGVLLFWAAVRARGQWKLIGWSILAAIALLVGSQGLTVVSGVASGENESSWLTSVVLAGIAAFDLAAIAIGVGGVLLLLDLFKKRE